MNALFPDAVNRDELDFNRTPAWVVELLIPYLGQPRTILDAGCGDGAIGKVLRRRFPDARIGGIEMDTQRHLSADAALCTEHGMIYDELWCWNWIDPPRWPPKTSRAGSWDLIVSNPPFGLAALDFLRCAMERIRSGGTVAFLLPTHWDHDCDASCGDPLPAPKKGKPAPRYSEEQLERARHEKFARQRFLDSIRLPDGREGYAKLAIVGGGPNPARPAFRGGSDSASDRYAWFMFGEHWAGQPSRRLHAIPPKETSGQTSFLEAI